MVSIRPLGRRIKSRLRDIVDGSVRRLPVRSRNRAVILRLDALGDFVIWLQSGAAGVTAVLRRDHDDVVLVANLLWAPLARRLGLWDLVVAVDPGRYQRSLLYRLFTSIRTKRLGARTVVSPRVWRGFLLEDRLVYTLGAASSIGASGGLLNEDASAQRAGNRYYTALLPTPIQTVHETIRNQTFAHQLGGDPHLLVPYPTNRGLPLAPVLDGRPYLAVALGAGVSYRRWPVERFASVVNDLLQSYQLGCVLLGTAEDESIASSFKGAVSYPICDLTSRLPIEEVGDVIAKATLVLANESGLLHLALWAGSRVVAVVGGGHFGLFAPYPIGSAANLSLRVAAAPMPCFGCNWACIFPVAEERPKPCILEVEPATVLQQCRATLDVAGTERKL